MKIRSLVLSSTAGLVLLLGLGGVTAYSNIEQIRIGGPIQTRNQQASDLIADILPPPEYVIEAYLEATLLHAHPAEYASHAERLAKLKADYELRHAYWLASDFDAAIRDKVTQGSHAEADAFWKEVD